MNNLSDILTRVNKAIKAPLNPLEIDKVTILLHNKLSEPKWAIEDEKLRDECEKLLIQMVVKRYMDERINQLSTKAQQRRKGYDD